MAVARLQVKVVPGSSRNRIAGWLGDVLKVSVVAPPARGAANAAVQQLIADTLGLPVRAVAIVAGHAASRKTVEISGLSAEDVHLRLSTSR